MATQAQARQKNKRTTQMIAADLKQRFNRLEKETVPAVLEEIGELGVEHSKKTHIYKNITGALERSHSFQIALSGETAAIEFTEKDGVSVELYKSPQGQTSLLLYPKLFYGSILELIKSFDVMIQSFLYLRREINKLIPEKLRARRIF